MEDEENLCDAAGKDASRSNGMHPEASGNDKANDPMVSQVPLR